MLVKDVINIVKNSSLKNLKVSDELLLSYVYLATVELSRRLQTNIKSEIIKATPYITVYELMNDNVDQLLTVYVNGTKLEDSGTIDSKSKFKYLTYNSFIYTTDKEEDLLCIYRASPDVYKDTNDYIPLPNTALPALLSYIGYLGISTLGSEPNSTKDAMILHERFDRYCVELELQGYKVSLFNESLGVNHRGLN